MKKVKNLIKELQEFNPDADIMVSTGDTFEDVSDFSLSWGGPNSGDGETKKDTKHVYINFKENNREREKLTVEVYAHVRYWEDGQIGGVDDDPVEPNMPCIVCENGGLLGNALWCPKIDVETGQILNWQKGVEANVHYKVCDECGLTIMKGDNVLYEDEDYVPEFLCPKEEGYGDYIIMDIDADGYIQKWDKNEVIEFLKQNRPYE